MITASWITPPGDAYRHLFEDAAIRAAWVPQSLVKARCGKEFYITWLFSRGGDTTSIVRCPECEANKNSLLGQDQ